MHTTTTNTLTFPVRPVRHRTGPTRLPRRRTSTPGWETALWRRAEVTAYACRGEDVDDDDTLEFFTWAERKARDQLQNGVVGSLPGLMCEALVDCLP
jgi:hypothetical protein